MIGSLWGNGRLPHSTLFAIEVCSRKAESDFIDFRKKVMKSSSQFFFQVGGLPNSVEHYQHMEVDLIEIIEGKEQ